MLEQKKKINQCKTQCNEIYFINNYIIFLNKINHKYNEEEKENMKKKKRKRR